MLNIGNLIRIKNDFIDKHIPISAFGSNPNKLKPVLEQEILDLQNDTLAIVLHIEPTKYKETYVVNVLFSENKQIKKLWIFLDSVDIEKVMD